ncbi:Aldo/keto reductase [Athelia psychrophila]|uniref:Aldo/keto reductase n=1 Tax=Athelia psychrophila TaxID=1759441 RepID=A0A165WUF3_9AGAM|nr:Aldo/keto reductase [Fibularhizoctonia sp. CBS 109695]
MSSLLSLGSTLLLSSGHRIPLLGFGVYQNYDAKASCLEALKAGYRHIDSAQVYRNEAAVGEAAKESGLDRADLYITTKCVSKNHGYDKTLLGVDESLKKFGFDYIDLFLIHDPMSDRTRRLDTYRALQEARQAGKIRSVGVSNYGIPHMEELAAAGYEKPAVNQIELHPLCQQKDIVAYCVKNGIAVQAYCPILRGQFDEPVIQAIAQKHARDPAQILLRWSLQKGYIPLPKSATPARIHSNTQLYDFALDAGDMAALDGLDGGKAGGISWNPVDFVDRAVA